MMDRHLRAALGLPRRSPPEIVLLESEEAPREARRAPDPTPQPGYGAVAVEGPARDALRPSDGGWIVFVNAAEVDEPEPRAWVVPHQIPVGATTLLFGDAGTLKTWLALLIAICVAAGVPWLDQPVARRRVVYVDAELDAEEFLRRAYRVARGLGLKRPPGNLDYVRLLRSLAAPGTIELLAEHLKARGAGLVVLDSLSIACYGSDLERPAAMTDVMQRLLSWGSVLALDHTPKPQPGTNPNHQRPFGSQFKYAIARSVLQMHAAEAGQGVILRQIKSNFGRRSEPLAVRTHFEADAVRFSVLPLEAPELAGLEEQLPLPERLARALAGRDDPADVDALADELALTRGTIRNQLTVLRKQGRAEPVGDGRWRVVAPPVHHSSAQGNVNVNATAEGPVVSCAQCGEPLPPGYWHICAACGGLPTPRN